MVQMRISNLPRLLVLEGAGFRACSAGIQHPDLTLLVVFADGLLMLGILVSLSFKISDVYYIYNIFQYVSMVSCLPSSATNENGGTPRKQDLSSASQKKIQTNVRILRGHSGAITALHCVTRREVWDLVGDREDAGFFISGSTDCSVSLHIWAISSN
jgi:hypothetical protein